MQDSAFLSCTELKKLVVPSTIKYIQEGAFENCGIEEVTKGRNLKEGIFCNSESLVTVKLAKNVRNV